MQKDQKKGRIWLCRFLAMAMFASAVLMGMGGWTHDAGAAQAAESERPAEKVTILNLDTGASAQKELLPAGTMVVLRYNGLVRAETCGSEDVGTYLLRAGITPSPLEMVGVERGEDCVTITISDRLCAYPKKVETTPFIMQVRETADLPYGAERVVQEGADGVHTVVTEQVWVSGTLVSSQVVRDTTSEPVVKIVERGVAATSVSQDDYVVRVETNADGSGLLHFASGAVMKFKGTKAMTATAYTAGEPGVDHITATGTRVHIGVAAVDRRVIPLGTRMYVMTKGVEYGMAVAEDTGVLGDVIDLYHNTLYDCNQFGRRSCTVYILE